jgi:hypothetical protein
MKLLMVRSFGSVLEKMKIRKLTFTDEGFGSPR